MHDHVSGSKEGTSMFYTEKLGKIHMTNAARVTLSLIVCAMALTLYILKVPIAHLIVAFIVGAFVIFGLQAIQLLVDQVDESAQNAAAREASNSHRHGGGCEVIEHLLQHYDLTPKDKGSEMEQKTNESVASTPPTPVASEDSEQLDIEIQEVAPASAQPIILEIRKLTFGNVADLLAYENAHKPEPQSASKS